MDQQVQPKAVDTGDRKRRVYVPVSRKLILALLFEAAWLSFSIYVAIPWLHDLAAALDWPLAILIVCGVALIPGAANAFLIAGLLMDRRPNFRLQQAPPPVSILIAAYNEAAHIDETLHSLAQQHYGAPTEILVIDDGSSDATPEIVRRRIEAGAHPPQQTLQLIVMPRNGGKARALNAGLARASHPLVITLDADTLLYRNALAHLVINQIESPPHTAATAGTVLVRNSRTNLITKLQEWDYFLGIAVVKRVQSLLQGTLVAQGAFSIYRREVLLEVGGWPETVGEDIVLTWALLVRGYRVGYAENAFVFTNVPETYGAYYRQRKRWSRGLIEAFKHHPGVLAPTRLNAPFVYLNLTFPYLDAAYLFIFLPGVLIAVFAQNYAIVGLMTLLVIPLSALVNLMMYLKQRAIFKQHGLRVRRNIAGAIFFTLAYQLVLSPASVMGYLAEMLRLRKTW